MSEIIYQDRVVQEMCVNSPMRDRKIYLNEEIDRDSIFKLTYWLEKLEKHDKQKGTKEAIEIILDTYGGSAYHTLSAISAIESLKRKGYCIITTVHSTAFSGGFWILISGSKRRAYANSRIMVHNILGGTMGKHQDMIEDMEETEKIWTRLKKVVTDNTNISDEKMEEIKRCKYDWYFWGDEAMDSKYKIVDEIL